MYVPFNTPRSRTNAYFIQPQNSFVTFNRSPVPRNRYANAIPIILSVHLKFNELFPRNKIRSDKIDKVNEVTTRPGSRKYRLETSSNAINSISRKNVQTLLDFYQLFEYKAVIHGLWVYRRQNWLSLALCSIYWLVNMVKTTMQTMAIKKRWF